MTSRERRLQLAHDYTAIAGRDDLRFASRGGHDGGKGRINNRYLRARSDDVVKFNHVFGLHPHATVTDRQTEVPVFRCTMNINIATKRIRVLRFPAAQPEDAGNDWIAPRSIGQNNLASAAAVFEDYAQRRVVANFFGDLQFT